VRLALGLALVVLLAPAARAGDAASVRGHLMADPSFQDHSLRFLENHDEPRAAAIFPFAQHCAAAVVTIENRTEIERSSNRSFRTFIFSSLECAKFTHLLG